MPNNPDGWDINCCKCGKFILREERECIGGNINCVAGNYQDNDHYYDAIKDEWYCSECAKKMNSHEINILSVPDTHWCQ